MRKIPKPGIILGVLLVVVVLGFVIWNGSAGTMEETSDTTIVSIPSTTTTIREVSFIPAQAGGALVASGSSVSVTSDGGAIITGKFSGTASFGSANLIGNGEDDVFVGKILANGVWVWATQAGGTEVDLGFGVSVTSDEPAGFLDRFKLMGALRSNSRMQQTPCHAATNPECEPL